MLGSTWHSQVLVAAFVKPPHHNGQSLMTARCREKGSAVSHLASPLNTFCALLGQVLPYAELWTHSTDPSWPENLEPHDAAALCHQAVAIAHGKRPAICIKPCNGNPLRHMRDAFTCRRSH